MEIKKRYYLFLHLLLVFNIFSQRDIKIREKGANQNFQTVSTNPSCTFFNSGLTLVFSDEFNNGILDTSKWIPAYPWGNVNNDSSDSWCDSKEILFTGNSIKLGCHKRTNTNVLLNGKTITRDYAIGVISSKQSFKYGYYEMRCKIPTIAELWPAYWLFGNCQQEIDIFEFIGDNIKSSKSKAFNDPLWSCNPHLNKWYIPQECATANPIMSFHTPKSPCLNLQGSRRTVERTIEYSSWDVKPSHLNFNKGCSYDNIEIDVDFHKDWHTFAVSFQPDATTWYIDNIPQFTEYRYFIKKQYSTPTGFTEAYEPVCLSDFCFNGVTEKLYEQINTLRGEIDMKLIINNNHKSLSEYNLMRWIEEITDWKDGYLEVDYVRCYTYTSTDTKEGICKTNPTDFISFDVYPNPSNGNFTISTSNELLMKNINIFNSIGELVYSDSFSSQEKKLEMLVPEGLYIVELNCHGKTSRRKIIVNTKL